MDRIVRLPLTVVPSLAASHRSSKCIIVSRTAQRMNGFRDENAQRTLVGCVAGVTGI